MQSKKAKKFKTGMYGGKFMPFHKGHLHCVEVASSQCEKVYVLLFTGGDQESKILETRHEKWLTPEDRLEKITAACKKFSNVEVHMINTKDCRNPDGTENWDMETPLVLKVTGKLDAVYGSEPDYKAYFDRAYPGATFICIDKDRKEFPISGTMIRNMKSEEERKKWRV